MTFGREEVACDEAELGEEEFAEKLLNQKMLQEQVKFIWLLMNSLVLATLLLQKAWNLQQLEMLKYMRKFNLDDQSAILEKVNTGFKA